jgi:hypothetical protein
MTYKLGAALTAAVCFALPTISEADNTLCDDYNSVMAIFAEQGTEYRGMAEGPNHRLVQIFENVPTDRMIAIFHDRHNDQACLVHVGGSFSAFKNKVTLISTPS